MKEKIVIIFSLLLSFMIGVLLCVILCFMSKQGELIKEMKLISNQMKQIQTSIDNLDIKNILND